MPGRGGEAQEPIKPLRILRVGIGMSPPLAETRLDSANSSKEPWCASREQADRGVNKLRNEEATYAQIKRLQGTDRREQPHQITQDPLDRHEFSKQRRAGQAS